MKKFFSMATIALAVVAFVCVFDDAPTGQTLTEFATIKLIGAVCSALSYLTYTYGRKRI